MSRYAGRIKVVGADRMCWPVDAASLEALATSCYDPLPWTDPEPVEIISASDWYMRREKRRAVNESVQRIEGNNAPT